MIFLQSDLSLKSLSPCLSHGLIMKHMLSDKHVEKQNVDGRETNYTFPLKCYRNVLNKYQYAVKAARTKYLSDLICRTAHCPKVLFSTINTVLNPVIVSPIDSISHTCEDFLNFFIRKIESIREVIVSSHSVQAASMSSSCIFDCFDLVSLPVLEGIVKHMKLSHTPLDPIPPYFLNNLFEFMGPSILSIVNSSLINGVVPPCLKQVLHFQEGCNVRSYDNTFIFC